MTFDVVATDGTTHQFPTRREAHEYADLLREEGDDPYVIAWPNPEDTADE